MKTPETRLTQVEKKFIDVTGLTSNQIAILEEIVAALKAVYETNNFQKEVSNTKNQEEEKLQKLHQEFDWLVADIGVKKTINRSDIYG